MCFWGELSLDELDAALDAEPVEVDVTLAEAEAAVTSASQALAAAVKDREQADAALVSLADRPAAQALAVHEAVLADAREAARVTTEQLEQVIDSPSLDELRADCATERAALDEVTAARDEIAEQLKQAAPTAKKQLYERPRRMSSIWRTRFGTPPPASPSIVAILRRASAPLRITIGFRRRRFPPNGAWSRKPAGRRRQSWL